MSNTIVPKNHTVNNPVTHNRVIRVISILTAVLVLLLALGAFALSYSNLRLVAVENGIAGWLSYVWPLLIDASLIVFSLAVVNAYLQGESKFKQWSLVGVYTVATVSFNVLHAPSNLQAQVVAAIAPVSLFFSFELLMTQLRNTIQKHGVIQGVKQLAQVVSQKQDKVSSLDTILAQKAQKVVSLDAQIDTLKAQLSELHPPNDTGLNKANDTRQVQIEQRKEQVLTLASQGMSQVDIANELRVSLATIKRDAKSLNGKVAK